MDVLDLQTIEALSDVLADTHTGLSGSELERLLRQCSIPFQQVKMCANKRTMLYKALSAKQAQDRCANNVIAFVLATLSPTRYTKEPKQFHTLREGVNLVLLFGGLQVTDSGQLEAVTAATNLSEAVSRANALKAKLGAMSIHAQVIKYCRRELLTDKNYFHSVFEAAKGVADRIRFLSGCTSNGAPLADDALATGQRTYPILCLNGLKTPSERNEQNRLCFIVKGLFSLYRNPKAHDPKFLRDISVEDALVAFQLMSVIHSMLDRVHDTRPAMTAMAAAQDRRRTDSGMIQQGHRYQLKAAN